MEDKEPKKVFAVTSGEYSDYYISAIFSTEILAQSYIDKHPNRRDLRIEEYILDEITQKTGFPYNVWRTVSRNSVDVHVSPVGMKFARRNGVKCLGGKIFEIAVIASSEEEALKIASERYMQINALNHFVHYDDNWRDYYSGEIIED